jgi:hypothetical protein
MDDQYAEYDRHIRKNLAGRLRKQPPAVAQEVSAPVRDQRIPDTADEEARIDQAVMALLTGSEGPWAVEEVAREVGDSSAAMDSLDRLHGAGLVHRLDDFVFATRAAVRSALLGQ